MIKSSASLLPYAALLAILSLPVYADDAALSPFGPQGAALEAKEFHLGDMRLLSLHDDAMVFANDGKIFGASVTPKDVAALLRAHGLPDDRISVSVNVLYVENGSHHYLFDTGLPASAKGNLLDNLAAHQIDPVSITDIFITHSHGDHIGGLLDANGDLAFPNAKVHMSAGEWEYMRSDNKNAATVNKVAPQMVTFEGSGGVAPGVTAFPLPGHTPGHSGYRITSKGQSLVDVGDLVHNYVISLSEPDWTIGFDGDKDTGEGTRKAQLAELARAQSLIFSTHFPYPGMGYIEVKGSAYDWKPQN